MPVEIPVDQAVEMMAADQRMIVRLEDLKYPVNIWDDANVNTSPLDVANTPNEARLFISGYAWGTAAYPEVPPLRLIDWNSKVAIVELSASGIVREETKADRDARFARTRGGMGLRGVPR